MNTILNNPVAEMDKIAEKISKLLSLAGNNPSEEEAKSALLAAQKLMAKYNITQEQIKDPNQVKYLITDAHVRMNPRSKILATIIADSFAVRTVMYLNQIHFFGYEKNATAAASALEFAHKVMERGMNKECKKHGLTGTAQSGASLIYNAYAKGFMDGLKTALDEQSRALAIVVPQDVNDKFNEKFPRLRTKSVTMRRGNYQDSYEQGKTDGRHVMSQRELEHK